MVLEATTGSASVDDGALEGLIAEQERVFLERQPRSHELHGRAVSVLAGGVTSSWQITRPQPVFIDHGKGSRLVDVDGNEYVDLHGGYGAGLAGHAHPAIVTAVERQVRRGTHFAQPNEDALAVAENLSRRFGLPLWRFTNSGTEATMDAVHLARAATGRDLIVKMEGGYHGHHDSVQVSVTPDAEAGLGDAAAPCGVAASSGIPSGITSLTLVATFNDLSSAEALFASHEGEIAAVILEPVMMNAGIILPKEGYLKGLGELTRRHGAVLIFDEVKTGLTAGPGGATGLYRVTPDLVCLAKAIGGGLITGALGGSGDLMDFVADGRYEMVGTFNGNPLSMAAARAMLEEVATEEAYLRLAAHRETVEAELSGSIRRHGLDAHVVSIGAKGCVTFLDRTVENYRDFLEVDDRFNHLHWLYQHNGGVFLPPWGKTEQWLVSVQHEEEDIARFTSNFERFADELAPLLQETPQGG